MTTPSKQERIKQIKTHKCWLQFATNWSIDALTVANYNKFITDHEGCHTKCLFVSSASLVKKYCQPKNYGLTENPKSPPKSQPKGSSNPTPPTAEWLSEINKLKTDFERKLGNVNTEMDRKISEKDKKIAELEAKLAAATTTFPATDVREREKAAEYQRKFDELEETVRNLQTNETENDNGSVISSIHPKRSHTIHDTTLGHSEFIPSEDEEDTENISLNDDIHHLVEALDREENPSKPGFALTKTLEKLDEAIPKSWRERDGSAYEYLISTYHRVCKRKRLNCLKTAYYVHNFFGAGVADKIELLVKNRMLEYVRTERRCLEEEKSGIRPSRQLLKDRLNERTLKTILYPAIAMAVQQKTTALATPSWKREEGDTIENWFKICLDYEKISKDTILETTVYSEKVGALKRMIKKCEDDKMPKLAHEQLEPKSKRRPMLK